MIYLFKTENQLLCLIIRWKFFSPHLEHVPEPLRGMGRAEDVPEAAGGLDDVHHALGLPPVHGVHPVLGLVAGQPPVGPGAAARLKSVQKKRES